MAVASVRIRRRAVGQAAGAPAALKSAELAYNMADGILYIGYGDDGGGNATSVRAIAKDTWVDPATNYQAKDTDLDALAALAATGLIARTGAGTVAARTITGTANRISVTNGDGVAGAPTLDLSTITIGGAGAGAGYTKVTVDAYGRITNTGQASLSDLAAPTGTYSVGAQLLQSSAVPSGSNDLTNKLYVDQAILNAQLAGDEKDSVRVASVANQALSGGTAYPTIDSVATTSGDRVLLRAQTAQAENGIYVVGGTAGAWTLTRATDFDAWTEIPGALVAVEEGTTYADSLWLSIANRGGTLGTTAIGWTRADAGAGGGFTVAGAGLTSSGATVDVVAGTGITVASDNVALTGQALALHNTTIAADQLLYGTGAGTFATTGFSSFARTLLDDVDAATMRGTLGLGTMATQAASNVAITGGTIDGVTIDGGTF
jgi:hypothetical protein